MILIYIKEVARRLNTTSKAIRFYENKELIFPGKDKTSGYRIFTKNDLIRLSTILSLREVGFQVKDIKELLEDPDMSITQYLNVQRSALFEKWIEMKDMLNTIDQMIKHTENGTDVDSMEDIHSLAKHLKNLKEIRKNWRDKWNFDNWADDFDQNIKKEGHTFNVHKDYDEALEKVAATIQLKEGGTCLDIGIGSGNLGSRFLAKGINVIGVDQSAKMLEACKAKHSAVDTRRGHFLALPLLDNQADGIVSSYALHHLPDSEKLLALEEMTRVLKIDGQICIADLMFINEDHRESVLEAYRTSNNTEAVFAIEDEYYGDRSLLIEWLSTNGYQVQTYQFNDILSMIYARKTGETIN